MAGAAPATPACSIAQADEILRQDSRFLTEPATWGGFPGRQWVSGPKTVADLLALYHHNGTLDFMVHDLERCTYGGAANAAETAARALNAAGLNAGDRVAVLLRNCLEWPVWFLGAMRAGGVAVPVNGRDTPAAIAATIEDCSARFLVSDNADAMPPASVDHVWTVGLDAGALAVDIATRSEDLLGTPARWASLGGKSEPLPELAPDDVAAIFYTSGTTGRPKGATITHRALTATIKNSEYSAARTRLRFPLPTNAAPPALARPIALFPVPFFHVTGAIPGLIASSALAAKIVVMRKWDVAQALKLIEEEHITLLGGVPTMPLQLLSDPRAASHDLSSLTGLIYGGAPAPGHLPEAIAIGLHAEAATGWGMTETASTVLHHNGPEYRLRPASCGIAVPVNAVRIADPDGRPVAVGESGELQVRGLNVMRGYWHRAQATRDAFTADGWLKSGDIARIDDEGFVTILDRAKDVIIRGGENIACIEIEDVLCRHADVVEAAVVGRPHPTLGEEPVAFVTLAPGVPPSTAGLHDHTALYLPRHKRPVDIFASNAPLGRNPAGKVVKAALRDCLAAKTREGALHG